jgi:NADH:ubiquinone oxidoreductase subunit
MRCTCCHIFMRYMGTDDKGKQYFECHYDGCANRFKLYRRYWESGDSFSVEEVTK